MKLGKIILAFAALMLVFPISFSQTNTTAGFTMEFIVIDQTSQPLQKNYSYATQISDVNITSTDWENNQASFEVSLFSNPNNHDTESYFFILTTSGDLTSVICNSTTSTSTHQTCTFTYPDEWETTEPTIYFYTQNNFSTYLLNPIAYNFLLLGGGPLTESGFTLTSEILLNITGEMPEGGGGNESEGSGENQTQTPSLIRTAFPFESEISIAITLTLLIFYFL